MAGWVAEIPRAIARHKPDPLSSVVLTIPVFVAYHLGVLMVKVRSGVDWVSGLAFELLDHSVPAYVGATLAAALLLMLAVWIQRRRGRVKPTALLPIVAESCVWAVAMLISIGWATHAVVAAAGAPAFAHALGPFDKLILSAGAGFHEEAVFRVGMLSGGALALQRWAGFGRSGALLVMLPASSAAFAIVHHLGPYAESVSLVALMFRALAGMFLAGVYLVRGFAVAVYTHAIYDALVFFVP